MNGWLNTTLINIPVVKQIINHFDPHDIRIFSFAIWDQHDLRGFDADLKGQLETTLGLKIIRTPTVSDDILPDCCAEMGIDFSTVDFSDVSDFWSKHQSFRLWLRHQSEMRNKNSPLLEVLFLDDEVFDEDFFWPTMNIRGRIRDICNLDLGEFNGE